MAAHIGVKRKIQVAQQHLSGNSDRNSLFIKEKIICGRKTERTVIQNDSAIDVLVLGHDMYLILLHGRMAYMTAHIPKIGMLMFAVCSEERATRVPRRLGGGL
jgi:hypothetical protein